MYSLEEHGLIEPGADGRTEGTVTVPFFKQSLVDASLDELKTQAIRKKLFESSGGLIGEGPSAQPE
jgi:arylsulfatase